MKLPAFPSLSFHTIWINTIHHANTKAFTNAFFPALGWALGLLPLAIVLGYFL